MTSSHTFIIALGCTVERGRSLFVGGGSVVFAPTSAHADVIDPLLGDGARDAGAVLDKIPKTAFGVGYRTTNEQPKPVRVRSVCPTNSEISELNARPDGVVAKHSDLLEVPQTWRTIVSRVRRVVSAWLLQGPRQRIEGAFLVALAVWVSVEFGRYLDTFRPVANSSASSDPEHDLLIANSTLIGNAHIFIALVLLIRGLFNLVRPLGPRPRPGSLVVRTVPRRSGAG